MVIRTIAHPHNQELVRGTEFLVRYKGYTIGIVCPNAFKVVLEFVTNISGRLLSTREVCCANPPLPFADTNQILEAIRASERMTGINRGISFEPKYVTRQAFACRLRSVPLQKPGPSFVAFTTASGHDHPLALVTISVPSCSSGPRSRLPGWDASSP